MKNQVRFISALGLGLWSAALSLALLTFEGGQADSESVFQARASLHAAGRGNPWINLADGRDLQTGYSGPAALTQALQQDQTRPLSLASGDFDEDGVPDLVCGYAGGRGGIFTVHRGNVDAIYPNSPEAQQRKTQGKSTDSAFLSPARVFEVPEAVDFLGVGDFDADGHLDTVAAAYASNALYILPGNGRGGFGRALRIELAGAVTALATGEINRADGLTDLAVGIIGPGGAQALVFQGPEGVVRSDPEVFALPAQVSALALGQADDDYPVDLVVAAGNDLIIVRGQDRRRAPNRAEQAPTVQVIKEFSSDFAIVSVTLGDFTGDRRADIAVLTADGTVRVLERSREEKKNSPTLQRERTTAMWRVSMKVSLPQNVIAEGAPSASLLVSARVSSRPSCDLLFVNRANQQVQILSSDATSDKPGQSCSVAASLDLEDEPVAVLPMRLNVDAFSDLVILKNGPANLTVAKTAPKNIFTVNDAGDLGDCDLMDGVCNSGIVDPKSGACVVTGGCTLRAALQNAGNTAGADTVEFNIGGGGAQTIASSGGLFTGDVTIDGTTQPGFSGSPIIVLTGNPPGGAGDGLGVFSNSVVRGLVINQFGGNGIFAVGNNIIEGNFIGTDITGTLDRGNAQSGVLIQLGDNLIGGTTAQARNVVSGNNLHGVFMVGAPGAPPNTVRGNYIGTDPAGTADLGNTQDGVHVSNRSDTVIGGAAAGARNVIGGNDSDGIELRANTIGTLVQGNYIGRGVPIPSGLGNTDNGVFISESPDNTIGGPTNEAENFIAYNDSDGVEIGGANSTGNVVEGNVTAFSSDGVFINGAPDNTIAGNNITDNGNGVEILGSNGSGNHIKGNYISTNNLDGVRINGAPNNTIGGAGPADGNLFRVNGDDGIEIFGASASGNVVQGNTIGGLAGGNLANGVYINSAPNNTVGGVTTAPGAPPGNAILDNFSNGVKIFSALATGNVVQGNLIGIDPGGFACGNHEDGVWIDNASNNTAGGTMAGARNVISGNGMKGGFDGFGVVISGGGSTANVVLGNFIGTNANGNAKVANVHTGVGIFNASGNTIGGTVAGARNLISGNGFDGIEMQGTAGPTENNLVQGNFIGTDVNGTADLGNTGNGVVIYNASNNTIGGTAAGAGNVISGNDAAGVVISSLFGGGGSGNVVQGNLIGTDASGNSDLGNSQDGVLILGILNNTIGGSAPGGAGNLISGNGGDGVEISASNGNTVQGNYIGTNAAGSSSLGNDGDGVRIGTANVVIGGNVAALRNLISGNGSNGIEVLAGGAASVQGNYIGTNAAGNAPLGNGGNGVLMNNGLGWGGLIGGSTTTPGTAQGNVISGNNQDGVKIVGSDLQTVQGNLIGTNAGGNVDLGNALNGVSFVNVSASIIGGFLGGTDGGRRNVISGNNANGISISGNASTNLQVVSNYIGTDLTGMAAIGNTGDGVFISGATSFTIGGPSSSAGMPPGNIVAFNANGINISAGGIQVQGNSITSNTSSGVLIVGSGNTVIANTIGASGADGVRVVGAASTQNRIAVNSISSNAGLGINLSNSAPPDGVTPNDSCDADSGANVLQNFPVLTSASSAGGSTTIQGTLNSAPDVSFNLEFFSNAGCDPSGNGEGQVFIGSTMVTTGASCNVSFTVTFAVGVATLQSITVTATDATGNTSEFSRCGQVNCTYIVAPMCAFFPNTGGLGSVSVTALAGCDWTAVSSVSWMQIITSTNGSGTDIVAYVVRYNDMNSARQGTLVIAGKIVTIVQNGGLDPGACATTVSPAFFSFSASGGTGTISVVAAEGCGWQVAADNSWVTITSCSAGIGSGMVTFSVGVNPGPGGRNSAIHIADKQLNVKQKAP